ncbi:MAG TPA: M14 family metallopeptidase [Opitutaceae bacterium]|nr:M14 family metallopeptidase [Opitutaceae bacterium]
MTVPVSKTGLDLKTLSPGFHRRRFTARDVGFDAWIWVGTPGPVVLINGGTHGDEYEGPTVLRTWAERWRPDSLHGTVVLVPVLNEAAFFAGQRCHPSDGGNLARSFPGNPKGKVSERLAHLFDTQLLAQATHYVDLHSAGASYELLPWVGYLTRPDPVGRIQRTMAACFEPLWCWGGPFLPGRTLSAAHARDIPSIYVECRGAGGVDPDDLTMLDRSLTRLLRALGCLAGKRAPATKQKTRITRDAQEAHLQVHHPAPFDGLFIPETTLAERVRKGSRIGTVHPLGSASPTEIRAERSGTVVMLRRQRSVRKGDALCTLAPI